MVQPVVRSLYAHREPRQTVNRCWYIKDTTPPYPPGTQNGQPSMYPTRSVVPPPDANRDNGAQTTRHFARVVPLVPDSGSPRLGSYNSG